MPQANHRYSMGGTRRMPQAIQFAQRAAKFAWQALRHITGDAAYDTYVRYCETRHAIATTSTTDPANRSTSINESSHSTSTPKIMTREQFYTDSLRRKYSTINRCC